MAGYCRKNELDAAGIRIELGIETDPESKLMSQLTYTIFFPDAFPAEHREPIRENASNCYIKRHLVTPPKVDVILS